MRLRPVGLNLENKPQELCSIQHLTMSLETFFNNFSIFIHYFKMLHFQEIFKVLLIHHLLSKEIQGKPFMLKNLL